MHYRWNLDANIDATITESEMHFITSKLDQNMNQELDQQIRIMIKKIINRPKAGSNLDKTVTELEMHLITSKLDQNINQKPDQQINN